MRRGNADAWQGFPVIDSNAVEGMPREAAAVATPEKHVSTLGETAVDDAALAAEQEELSPLTQMAIDGAASRPLKPPPHLYVNRELGQLEFNRRVLAQAADPSTPLLERLKFLCIVSSNLDEFFEIRVAGVQAEIEAGLGARRSRQDAPAAGVRAGRARSARARRGTVSAAQQRSASRDGSRRHPLPAAHRVHARTGRVDQGLLPARSDAGVDADRARSGASVSARAQQESQFRGGAAGQGRVRTQLRHRDRAGAARSAARHPAARRRCDRPVRFRVPLVHSPCARRRALRRHACRRLATSSA